jgi:hypothetical protein
MTVRQVFYRLVGAYGCPKTEPAYVTLSDTLIMARRAGRRLAGCGIGRMSPTRRVGTISR